MRWLGVFLDAKQNVTSLVDDNPALSMNFSQRRCRLTDPKPILKHKELTYENMEDNHHQACAIVEQLVTLETPLPDIELGGGDTQNMKKSRSYKDDDNTDSV